MSSAHVYLRLPHEGVALADIPPDTLEDCCQLVKANSIQGGLLLCVLCDVCAVCVRASLPSRTARCCLCAAAAAAAVTRRAKQHAPSLPPHSKQIGCKLNNVVIVYTRWANLKKRPAMEVGQVGFHDDKDVLKYKVCLAGRVCVWGGGGGRVKGHGVVCGCCGGRPRTPSPRHPPCIRAHPTVLKYKVGGGRRAREMGGCVGCKGGGGRQGRA